MAVSIADLHSCTRLRMVLVVLLVSLLTPSESIPMDHSFYGAQPKFMLPSTFRGTWAGVPASTILGPFLATNITFTMTNTSTGDFVFEDNFSYDQCRSFGYQRFYVERETGFLWYCGVLANFSDAVEPAGMYTLDKFNVSSVSNTSISFCVDISDDKRTQPARFPPGCTGCDCGSWSFTLSDPNTMISSLTMAGAQHLMVTYHRVGPASVVDFKNDAPKHANQFTCDFKSRDAHPVAGQPTCPYSRASGELAKCPHKHSIPTLKKQLVSGYENCNLVNQLNQFVVQWTLDKAQGLLHLAISAAKQDPNSYVSLGFRPWSRVADDKLATNMSTGIAYNFAMMGADVVIGSASIPSGALTMYANQLVGAPTNDTSLKISDVQASYQDGMMVLQFTRPLVGGKLAAHGFKNTSILSDNADMLWAVGHMNGAEPSYHMYNRGLLYIDWEKPSSCPSSD